ncbi:MAG: hypothetical protein P8Z42_13485 [Anaerolineales bacterium]
MHQSLHDADLLLVAVRHIFDRSFEVKLQARIQEQHPGILQQINRTGELAKETEQTLREFFREQFQ